MRNRAVIIYRSQYDQLRLYRLLHLWLMIAYVICSVLGSAIVVFGTSFKDQIGTTASLVLNIVGACIVVAGTILMEWQNDRFRDRRINFYSRNNSKDTLLHETVM